MHLQYMLYRLGTCDLEWGGVAVAGFCKKKYAIQQQNHDGMGTAIKDTKDINKNVI